MTLAGPFISFPTCCSHNHLICQFFLFNCLYLVFGRMNLRTNGIIITQGSEAPLQLDHLHNLLTFIYHPHLFFLNLMCASLSQVSCSNSTAVTSSTGCNTLLSHVGSISRAKSLPSNSLCSESSTSSLSPLTSHCSKAPGFERDDQVHLVLSLGLL